MDELIQGKIMKATGGFYYVHRPGAKPLECRARGLFRNQGVSPLVGDEVQVQPGGDGTGTVVEILPRRNALVRPPLANLDHMVVVLSVTDPAPNLFVVDKFIALLEKQDIAPILAITKADLAETGALATLYRGAGYPVHIISSETGHGVAGLAQALLGTVSAFSGNSGVGKSSLLNAIDPRFAIQVGDTSKKLGRGRHTTRHVELFALQNGALIADTPGFSSMDVFQMGGLDKEELGGCFREFGPHLGSCRFVNCAHVKEKGCAVLNAVQAGEIDPRRHASYVQLYDEIKDVKPWEKK